ncbi:AAA family ATPase [Pseudoalteromonas sp. SCSIO 43088]|uniref:AAA family ATPase n=1 Tax=Pseudoalteromonas sp. SCSIO 43088 TaxID=2822846 RepID=UPI00202AD08E|nr:AAA family ATPase [Pseudoalteromonas sp. SCSIO 43088]URQ85564.1 AAA family ATPase [Pseudoalteromonas sp. SCSIO 43088]
MWIKEINITGVGGIENLDLTLDPKMNIICGPNGIGKTTILESVAHTFSNGRTNILKRNAKCEKSHISAKVDIDGAERASNVEFTEFMPSQQAHIYGLNDLSRKLLSLKINRTFEYQPLKAVGKDTEKPNGSTWGEARVGVNLNDVKNWFVNRYLYSPHGTLTTTQIANYELARDSFSALNKNFTFSRVDASTNEILVNTPSGEIYYEYLSSGFKSCLSIIFGIIKEIEFRFVDPKIKAKDFDGIILIDEVELHLHPEWQAVIASVLTEVFPDAQFICTTHSPHIIQSAQPNQIIAIEGVDGKATQRPLPSTEHGFKGWTIEEVLMDVMGMYDLRTNVFKDSIIKFDSAIEEENYDAALSAFYSLDSMLHPNNHMRKMLKFQLASIKGVAIDKAE